MPQKWLDPVQEGLPAPVVEAVSELRRIYQDGPFERLRQVEDAIVAARATTPGLVTVSAATCSRMLSPSRTELHKTALPRWPSVQAFLAVHGVDPGPFEPRWVAARQAWASRRDGRSAGKAGAAGVQDIPTEPGLRAPDLLQGPPTGPEVPVVTQAPAGTEPAAGAQPAGGGAALRNGSGEPGAVLAGDGTGPAAGSVSEPTVAVTPTAPVPMGPGPAVAGPEVAGPEPAGPEVAGSTADGATGPAVGLPSPPGPQAGAQPPPAVVWWRRPLVVGGLLLAALGLIVVGMLLGYLLARYQFLGQGPTAAQLPVTCVRAVPEAGIVVGAEVEMVCRPVAR